MKLSEIAELDDCKNQCPCYGEYCSGGMMCYGGSPIEPPCVIFPDDDADEFCDRSFKAQIAHDKWEDEQIRKKKIKEEEAKIRKDKLWAYKLRNCVELGEIKRLEKNIKETRKFLNFLNCFASAVNETNKMFRQSGCDCPNDIKPKTGFAKDIEDNQNEIIRLKQVIKNNEKAFKNKQKENKSE